MKKKPLIQVLLNLFLLCLFAACDRPKLTGVSFDEIDTSQDPRQSLIKSNEPVVITIKDGSLTLVPMAEYRLSGMVISRESYCDGWESKISPVDLAIVWGKLAEPHYETYISYSQSNRWYFFKVKAGSPFDTSYVSTHSSNNHIIPVNDNVRRALKSIGGKERVVLEGFLANIKGAYKGEVVTWNSSLSRADTGNGSCELFYVTKARIGSKVYE